MLQNILSLNYRSKTIGYTTTDILIIGIIYLLPSFSHLTSIPFYLFEPMRLAIVFCIINTNQKNSILIALTLPAISLILSSHPDFVKSLLITAELVLNVLAFYFISKRLNNSFIVMLISILMAKIFYYSSKLVLLNMNLIQGGLISTPLWIQYIMMFFFSIYTVLAFKKNKELQF